jgi:histone deacetylase complex regulatory component SIN3
VLADSRSQELFELLKRDRALQVPTIQDQLNSRRFAENLLGPDENIFRIDWVRFFYLQVLFEFSCMIETAIAPRREDDDDSITRER